LRHAAQKNRSACAVSITHQPNDAALVTWDVRAVEMMKLLLEKARTERHDLEGRTAADRAADAAISTGAKFLLSSGRKTADAAAS